MSTLLQDLSYALRLLRKSPGYTAIVILVLGFGIGANTALFSVVDAVLLRPLPYPQPDRLAVILERIPDRVTGSASLPNYSDWRVAQRSFTDLALERRDQFNLSTVGQPPERIAGATITANYFNVLGTHPALGRDLTEAEDTPGGPAAVLLGDALWRRRFGANPAALGKRLLLDGVSREIVGVLPPTVDFPRTADVFVPLGDLRKDKNYLDRGSHNGFRTLGRLKPGISLDQAGRDLDAIAVDLERRYPATNAGRRLEVRSLLEYTAGAYRGSLYVLLGAVGCILLTACANVANLQLARATARRGELAVRAALGASRGRLVRQMMAESVALGLLGGLAGVFIALWVLDAIVALSPANAPRFHEARLNLPAVGFAAAVALATGLLAGIWPAWQATGCAAMARGLHESSARGGGGDRGKERVRALLVVGQMALAMVTLAVAGLMFQSLWRALKEPLGFRPQHLLTAWFSLPRARYDSEDKQAAFFSELLDRVNALPGVSAAAVSATAPFSGDESDGDFHVTGTPPEPPGKEPTALQNSVSSGYFQAMGMPLLRGRAFGPQAGRGQPPAVIIDQLFAERYFPDGDPIGQHIDGSSPGDPPSTIVGVVPHVRTEAPTEQSSLGRMVQIYYCSAQTPTLEMTLLAHLPAGDPLQLVGQVRQAVQSLDPELPLSQIRTMEESIAAEYVPQRSTAVLLCAFAGIALVLANLGLYGVMALRVTQRSRELGIRMALGAPRANVLGLVLRQGATLIGIGWAVGLLAALVSGRLLASGLYGIGPGDPATLAVVSCVLGVVALLACWLPAHRATLVNPMVALRNE